MLGQETISPLRERHSLLGLLPLVTYVRSLDIWCKLAESTGEALRDSAVWLSTAGPGNELASGQQCRCMLGSDNRGV